MKRKIEKAVGKYLNTMASIAPGHTGKLGFKLFGRPARRSIKPVEKHFFDSSKEILLQHNKLKIRGYQWGSGPKNILLLHGWQSHSAKWIKLVRTFPASDYTIYAIDAPGHGQSSGHFFTALLYGEVILQFSEQVGKLDTVIGHSLGAFSALYVISQFNLPKTDRLVILATPGSAEDFITYFKQRLELSEDTIHCIRQHFQNETGWSFEDLAISRFAEQLDLPGLIIHDKNDRYAPFGYAQELHRKWTNSNLMVTEGEGHNLSSDEITKAILCFVNGQCIQSVNEVNS